MGNFYYHPVLVGQVHAQYERDSRKGERLLGTSLQ